MSRHPAKVTQATVARCIRAAKAAGGGYVDVLPDGTVRIRLDDAPQTAPDEKAANPWDEEDAA